MADEFAELPIEALQVETLALHAGESPHRPGDPVAASIVTATSFHATPEMGFSSTAATAITPHFYTRWGNPTVAILEDRLAALEEGAGSVAFASGMAAAAALFLTRLRSGDHLILSEVCYPGIAELAADSLTRLGICVSFVDTSKPLVVARAIRPGQTKLIHIETPSNLILRLSDIGKLAEIARHGSAELSVDSTIATPIATRPLSLGADYALHSLTKYLCGHGDALGGAIVARNADRLIELRRNALVHHGGALSPFSAWLILRGIETLPLRMQAHEDNARYVAQFLLQHPLVSAVYWPGLSSHPQAALARTQMRNFSGLLSFTVRDDSRAVARRLAERLKVFSYAVSIGKTRSLLYFIPTSEILNGALRLDAAASESYRSIAGAGVFRVSVGLENRSDLIGDLSQALGQP